MNRKRQLVVVIVASGGGRKAKALERVLDTAKQLCRRWHRRGLRSRRLPRSTIRQRVIKRLNQQHRAARIDDQGHQHVAAEPWCASQSLGVALTQLEHLVADTFVDVFFRAVLFDATAAVFGRKVR